MLQGGAQALHGGGQCPLVPHSGYGPACETCFPYLLIGTSIVAPFVHCLYCFWLEFFAELRG